MYIISLHVNPYKVGDLTPPKHPRIKKPVIARFILSVNIKIIRVIQLK